MINIRYEITQEFLDNGASHIGYSIRPTERRKGYNKIQLYLGLIEEKELNENKVSLNCTVNNFGSNKTIISLGGILDKTEIDSNDGEMTNYYWINVDDKINKYSSIYCPFIKN